VTLEQNPLPGNLDVRVRRLPSPDPRVDVFWCALDDDAALAARVASWLSADERARATRFGSDALRRRYVIGRATLRALLGRRLQTPPEAVMLARGRRGRPRLAAAGTLDFNVSHTQEVLLAAIADGITIGVDVEHAGRAINTAGIARRCLAPAEQRVVAALDAEAARRDVLQRWTCKEAMSKATGDAMSAPFRRLDLELRDHPVLVAGPPPYLPDDWALRALPVEGFFATLALWSARPHER
jgi:4'-phosphopantetheinyl transferase